jgi:hypothetical protein
VSNPHVERIGRQTRFSFIGFETVTGLITASASADRLFGLGWGYGQRDAVYGLGIMLAGGLVYGACRLVFGLVRSVGS